jgi:beta-glucanase (GH16 family)
MMYDTPLAARVRRVSALAVAVGACATFLLLQAPPPAHADTDPSAGKSLIFSDDFDGTALDTAKWTPRADIGSQSTQQADNLSVSGGELHIALVNETSPGSTNQYTGGGIISNARFGYGYYETRAKINTGPGWHSAFWSMCTDPTTPTNYNTCKKTEIDGFEIDSARPHWIKNNIFDWPARGNVPYANQYDPAVDVTDWRTYGYDYDETGVRFYIDGELTSTLAYTGSAHAEDLMNIWFSTISLSDAPDPARLPASVDVDYVKFFQKGVYVDNDGLTSAGYHETGTWASSGLTGMGKSGTRYATGGQGTATWGAQVPATGQYSVAAWVPSNATSGNATAATYAVTHDGVSTEVTVNTQTGSSHWVDLGTYTLTAGQPQSVTLRGSGGFLRADTVRFVPTS